jgi:biotin transporter BioY
MIIIIRLLELATLAFCALGLIMAALIAVGGYLAIPIGPVPIVLQNLFVLVAALLLGSRWASAAVAVYLLAGACGLPVFAGGGGGLGHLFGPRGGYLFGFLAAAWLVGKLSEISRQQPLVEIVAMVIGGLVIYELGRLPKRNEVVVIDGIRLQVLRADSRRVHTLLVDPQKRLALETQESQEHVA